MRLNDPNAPSAARPIAVLVLIYLLMFWADLPAFRPGMDAMTYGKLAKNILATGDWKVLHYHSQAYSNFYQHPPLAIWMMAATMKFLGTGADRVLKVLPAVVGGLCTVGVYLWGRRARGPAFAFVATVVLLTSTRFAKFSRGFMLDPFLAAFSVWAVFLACEAILFPKKRPWYAMVAGIFVTSAFLSKGLFAFAPFAVILLLFAREAFVTGKGGGRILLFLVGVGVPAALWFAFGGASHFLERYYAEHVAERMAPHPFRDHLEPLVNLAKVYWPWLPFFAIGLWKTARIWRDRSRIYETAFGLAALAFIGGFMLIGSFLEQYHTATYPFAALVVAAGIPIGWEKFRVGVERTLLALAVGLGIFVIARPYAMQGTEHRNPMRIALKAARNACRDPAIRRISISTDVAEIWYALAMGGWNTDWDTHSGPPSETPAYSGAELLLATRSATVAAGWVPTSVGTEGLMVYRAATIGDCASAR